MKICIYGAGAIGGYLGVKLALAGADVSLVARGAHLAAMRDNGLKLLIGDESTWRGRAAPTIPPSSASRMSSSFVSRRIPSPA